MSLYCLNCLIEVKENTGEITAFLLDLEGDFEFIRNWKLVLIVVNKVDILYGGEPLHVGGVDATTHHHHQQHHYRLHHIINIISHIIPALRHRK